MLHPLIIILIAVFFVHQAKGVWFEVPGVGAAEAAALTLSAHFIIAVFTGLWLMRLARLIDRTGSVRLVNAGERIVLLSQILATAVHAVAVLALGWLDAVRAVTGNLVLVDEAIAILPPLLVFVAGWWSFYPIERRLREAMLLRTLDRGEPVHPIPTRWAYVCDQARHKALIILAPLALILAWHEIVVTGAGALAGRAPWLADPSIGPAAISGAQLLGVAAIFLISPFIVRIIWNTVPLGPGELRSSLEDLCRRHRVRVRRMLVWRTHGMMINGAVVGLIAPLRYILLTDALLERLPQEQIEAVMAHEVGHVRRRHIIWLLGALITTLGVSLALFLLPLELIAGRFALTVGSPLVQTYETLAMIGSIGAALLVFGYISRRFEHQADAFAALHMSGLTRDNDGAGVVMTEEGAEAMAGALGAVARLNHIPPQKFTWRHGSIADRQRALRAAVGVSARALPIDRAVRRLKLLTILGLVALAGLTAWEIAAQSRQSTASMISDSYWSTTASMHWMCAPEPPW
ncbi:MAG: hypothetical protein EA376_08085 [Phycisphaeraceae bacterium]|nr:MAG: hypothetical protein EA376_08085 [Phycisphaeraceae bacterium]